MGDGERRCITCGRTGLDDEDFPRWCRGTINTCKQCINAKSKREYARNVATIPDFPLLEAMRVRDYRERKMKDPAYREKERLRVAASRERAKHAHAA